MGFRVLPPAPCLVPEVVAAIDDRELLIDQLPGERRRLHKGRQRHRAVPYQSDGNLQFPPTTFEKKASNHDVSQQSRHSSRLFSGAITVAALLLAAPLPAAPGRPGTDSVEARKVNSRPLGVELPDAVWLGAAPTVEFVQREPH